MPVFRTLVALHFTLYQSALALLAMTVLIHLFSTFSWLQSAGCGVLMVTGFWLSQGAATLINRALGYGGKSRSGSVD
jgi:hypothetical protein